jgi:hypothetical protein
MQMVAHFGVEADFDAEQGGELPLDVAEPVAAMVEVPPGRRIVAAQEGPPNAPAPAMIDANFPVADNFPPSRRRHADLPQNAAESN